MNTDQSNTNKSKWVTVKTWWVKRSELERKLLVSLIIVALLSTGLLLFIVIKHAVKSRPCATTASVLAASQIITHIDPTVDPCENFFKFACGKFIKQSGADILASSVMVAIDQVSRRLKEIIEEPLNQNENYMVRRQKEFFKACMNESFAETEALDIFKKSLEELNGWTVVTGYKWKAREFDWKDLVYKLRRKGYPHSMILSVTTIPDPVHRNRYIVRISQPYVRKVKETNKSKYIKRMVDLAVLFGAEKTHAETEMVKVLNFMGNLRKVADKNQWGPEEDETEISDIMAMLATRFTVEEFENRYNNTNWLSFINTMLYPVAKISPKDFVVFPKTEFLEEFFRLIELTPKRTQANYIIWSVIEDMLTYFPKHLFQVNTEDACKTKTTGSGRFKFCKREIRKTFLPLPSDITYARKYVPAEKREPAKELLKTIKLEFMKLLTKTSWMDKESKARAQEKLEALTDVVGAPGEYFDDAVFAKFELESNITKERFKNVGFFNMYLSRNKQLTDAMFSEISKPFQDHEMRTFYGQITEVNGMYFPEDNTIMIPAGILQEVFYDPQKPMYLNYGGIGTIIGHELTHGFAEIGSEYDKDGNPNRVWTERTLNAYRKKAECIVQDAEYFDDSEEINGTLILEENIADYTGLKVAYAAYKNWVAVNGGEAKLPGIDYTPLQLFWISAVFPQCYQLDQEDFAEELNGNVHAYNVYRAIGPIRNNPDFANDFQCPTGSKMNPLRKCQVF